MQTDRVRKAILRRMERSGGLWVICLRCDATTKHDPFNGPRLKYRRCRLCGGRMRKLAWAQQPKNAERLMAERLQERKSAPVPGF